MKSAAPDVPTTEIFKASWPFVWIIVLGAVFMALFPPIVTFLPGLTGARRQPHRIEHRHKNA